MFLNKIFFSYEAGWAANHLNLRLLSPCPVQYDVRSVVTQVHEASDFLGVVTMGVQVLDLIRSAQFFYWAHRSRFYPVGNAAQ